MASVLLSSSGRRVELWKLFERASRDMGLGWSVAGIDARADCATALLTQSVDRVPRVGDNVFEPELRKVVLRRDVRIIVPTIDPELPWYASWSNPATRVVVSSPGAVRITRNKLEMFRWAADRGLPTPDTNWLTQYATVSGHCFAVKPVDGSSSVGLRLGLRRAEVARLAESEEMTSMIVQEQLEGDEYTVNCFIRDDGGCAYSIPHRRIAVRAGEVSHGITVRRPEIEALARQTLQSLPGVRGPVCVQIIDDVRRGPALIEVNLRFGGGYPLAHEAGARAPERILAHCIGADWPHEDQWVDGLEMVRFDASVFRRLS